MTEIRPAERRGAKLSKLTRSRETKTELREGTCMLCALQKHWPEYLFEAFGLGVFMLSACLLRLRAKSNPNKAVACSIVGVVVLKPSTS